MEETVLETYIGYYRGRICEAETVDDLKEVLNEIVIDMCRSLKEIRQNKTEE